MSDLIREIDEEVAKDRSEQFIEKWGLPIGIFVVVLLAGLFLFLRWQNSQEVSALTRADNFQAGTEALATDPESAQAIFTDLTNTNSGFAELSTFKIGDALWNQGNHEEALAAWGAYAADPSNNENLRNTAQLKRAWFGNGILEQSEIDAAIAALEPLPAYENMVPVLRGLNLISKGEVAEGRTILETAASNESASDAERNLALSLLGLANSL